MLTAVSPLAGLRQKYADGTAAPRSVMQDALAHANSNAGANVYLVMDPQRSLAEADALAARFPSAAKPLLFGVPVSLKDCFDLAGFTTTCGSRFYAEKNGVALQDSAVASKLREAGALITGKTHLHALAYGITGENPEYGDCAQPRNAHLLTGGSSSGGAASVQEGSAIAAIGTDTGGSIRVPAALCGLAGYRSSHGLADSLGLWQGAMHLAPSFDTLGWLFRDLRDGPALGEALFGLPRAATPSKVRIGSAGADFTHDSEPAVLATFEACKAHLEAHGASIETFSTDFWSGSMEVFAGIQAHEAAAIHRGNFGHFQADIAERLAWGESITPAEVARLCERHAEFRSRMDALLRVYDFIVLPCAPMCALRAGADHSATRRTILRYTAPVSLAGMPTVTLCGETLSREILSRESLSRETLSRESLSREPQSRELLGADFPERTPGSEALFPVGGAGAGVQLVAARGDDARLLAFAASLAG